MVNEKLSKVDRQVIYERVDNLVESLAESFKVQKSLVANSIFMRVQKHPQWGRNATSKHKNQSYQHWKGICPVCEKPVDRKSAIFHHLKRGVDDLHGPENLVPTHNDCHDRIHQIKEASLTKGTLP